MKTIVIIPGLWACLVGAPAFAATQVCADSAYLMRVGSGWIEHPQGTDNGDAIYFQLTSGATLTMHGNYNMDSHRGRAMHRMLVAALAANLPVSAYDSSGSACQVVDSLRVNY